jgi:adenine-specific DNA-methyltransferase
MATINDLISRIQDPDLRMRIEKEVKDLTKQKKFGLVFEKHEPEMTLLYDYPISRGCKVIRKSDDDKKISEDILWEVKKITKRTASCVHTTSNEELIIPVSDLICVAKNGEPIYPCLKLVDSVQKATDTDLWHTLIEADNYHALQLLSYLYPGMVDCIYIDPPYNSGATDWKYNNNYVDGNDSYRHSKWLAMIESRLLLAKKLLNPNNSVLIVTIDEKEYLHLGCLLEDMFPEAEIQMVSSVIMPSGSSRTGRFGRADEYIFFCFIGESVVVPGHTDMLRDSPEKTISVRWNGLIRNGEGSRRQRIPSLFYPILFNKENGQLVSVEEPIPADMPVKDYQVPEGMVAMWPIDKSDKEQMWRLYPPTLREYLKKGYAKLGKIDLATGTRPISYLQKGMISKINSGKIIITGKNEDGALELEYADGGKTFAPLTVWNRVLHSAAEHGSGVLKKILLDRHFPFPKSVYAVKDCLRFVTANKKNALIVDFFAGSGTTLQAVNLLNKEDGGHRRCIMVTNNEVSADEETIFRSRGLHKGDEEWEKFGIARYINWPRTKCSIKGIDINEQPIKGEYITSNTQEITQKRTIKQLSFVVPEGNSGTIVKKQIVALINDKHMPQNSVTEECPYIIKDDASSAILFDINSLDEFFDEIHDDIETIYVVTPDNKAFNAAKRLLAELPEKTKMIPVTIPMSEGFNANAAYYKLIFLDKEAVSIGTQLDELLSILWMKAGAYGVCPTHVEGEYAVFPKNRMAILIDEFGFDELKEELVQHPEIETVYIIDDSEDNYRTLAAQLKVKNIYQLYRDYLDNFKINIERK